MSYQAPDFPSKWEKAGFSILKVTGSGDKKDYLRVCDTVVRNSRLFQRLYQRLQSKTVRVNSESYLRNQYKERLASQHRELKDFVKFSNSHIAKLEKRILKLEKDVKIVTASRNKYENNWRWELGHRKNAVKKYEQLLKNMALYSNHERFFTLPLFARDVDFRPNVRAELFLRAIIAFREQEDLGIISYKEFLILATGMHVKAFNKTDLINRFTTSDVNRWFTKSLNKLIEAGMIRRFERRNLFYITDAGKARLGKVMSVYNTQTMKTYWGGTFNEFKDTKRNLPTAR